MKYNKAEVIEKGKKASVKLKKLWLILAIAGFGTVGLLIIEWAGIAVADPEFAKEFLSNKINIFAIVEAAVFCLGFGVFALIYRKRKQYDPLLEGCKSIEREIKGKINKENRIEKSDAKNIAENIGSSASYYKYSTDFKAEELRDLLEEHDVVEYIGFSLGNAKLKSVDVKIKQDYDEHNFDPELTDVEYDDLMDD